MTDSFDSSAQEPDRRWFYRPSLGVLVRLLTFEALLLLADRLHWFTYTNNSRLTTWLACGGVVALFVPSLIRLSAVFAHSSWRAVSRFLRARRWYQFSLRSLLVFTLLFALTVGWLGSKIAQKGRERQAVEAIARAGGQVWFDQQRPNNPNGPSEPSGPRWLRSLLGDNFFSEIKEVELSSGDDATLAQLDALRDVENFGLAGSKITDAGLTQWLDHLKDLPQLRTLGLNGLNVGNSALGRIKELSQLEHLFLSGTSVTDTGLERLERIGRLKDVFLRNTPITGAGLVHLRGLTKLEGLCLMDTNVNDAGAAHLKDLIGLRRLWLGRTKMTDAGLANLRTLPQLQWLELDTTQVTDVGLPSLKELSRLQYLGLSNTQVTDAGLAELAGLKALVFLELVGTKVTAEGVKEFRKVRPTCRVAFGPGNGPIVQPPLAPSEQVIPPD